MSAGRTFLLGALAFAVAWMLNSETLLEMAQRQPFGWKRDVLVGITGKVHTLAGWTLLDRPGEWFDEARGLNRDAPIDLDDLVAPTTVPEGAAPTTVAAPTPLRVPTADDPLKVLIMGDSLAKGFGETFERYVGDTRVMVPSSAYKVSSGLTRPDYFDWPAEIVRKTTEVDPDVVVIMFGANDAQNLDLGGTIYGVTDQPWQDEYHRRVGAVMDYLVGQGTRVVWVGLPVMESDGFDSRMHILDTIYQEEAAKRPNVTFYDTRALFADANGNYQAYLPNGAGEQKLMRAQDGVHFSLEGASRMANATVATIVAMIPTAPAPATTPPSITPTSTG